MKILVTGANGFIGKNICKYFLNNSNYEIYALVRDDDKRKNLKNYLQISKTNIMLLNILVLDIKNVKSVLSIIKPNIVFHTICNFGRSSEKYIDLWEVNVNIGVQLIVALEGINSTFVNLNTILPKGTNKYANTKNIFSNFIVEYSRDKNNTSTIKFIDVFLEYVYGIEDDNRKLSALLINNCFNNEGSIELTDCLELRDFIYIRDVLDAFYVMIKNREIFENYIKISVGSGNSVKVRTFAEAIKKGMRSNTELQFGVKKNRIINDCEVIPQLNDVKKLGWNPKYSLEQAINEIYEELKNADD